MPRTKGQVKVFGEVFALVQGVGLWGPHGTAADGRHAVACGVVVILLQQRARYMGQLKIVEIHRLLALIAHISIHVAVARGFQVHGGH